MHAGGSRPGAAYSGKRAHAAAGAASPRAAANRRAGLALAAGAPSTKSQGARVGLGRVLAHLDRAHIRLDFDLAIAILPPRPFDLHPFLISGIASCGSFGTCAPYSAAPMRREPKGAVQA